MVLKCPLSRSRSILAVVFKEAPLNQQLIKAIHAAPGKFALAAAGGGSTAIADLLAVPGASQTLLEAIIPYDEESLCQYLHFRPEQLCSARTARSMAMIAWQRASRLQPDAPFFGLGVSAALATQRQRRGADRCHLAVQSLEASLEITLNLEKQHDRQTQEAFCKELILRTIAECLGIKVAEDAFDLPAAVATPTAPTLATLKRSRRYQTAPPAWQTLLQETPTYLIAGAGKTAAPPAIHAILSGSFNPLHEGHTALLHTAEKLLGHPAFMEISIWNLDKPPLDYLEMQAQQTALNDYPLLFSNTPSFEEKSRLFPGVTFILGLDTIVRIADPRYYDKHIEMRDQAIANMTARGNRFLVFGRLRDGRFETLNEVKIPSALRAICTAIPEADYRVDVSSSELRQRDNDAPT